MDLEFLREKIDRILTGEIQQGYEGYGISNVIRRLSNHFGDKYSIELQSLTGKGTVFTIVIPKIEA